jgi:hypothetical protein
MPYRSPSAAPNSEPEPKFGKMIVGIMLCAALPHRSSLKIGLERENRCFVAYRRLVTQKSGEVALATRSCESV